MDNFYKVRSIISLDEYWTNKELGSKFIDGKEFRAVKKRPEDEKVFFVLKENLEVVK